MGVVKETWDLLEVAHPFLEQVKMRVLLSRKDDGAGVSCILVRCPVGSEIEEHVHPRADDIIYVLEGRATMWVDGVGEFPLKKGIFVRVTRGTRHRTYDVKEELVVYDVFSPPMF